MAGGGSDPGRLPLDDLRVIDLTAARAGPQCVRQLADWGADVIRVEQPSGRAGELNERHASDFQNLHRNTRSITLDLKRERGRELFFRLVERADVVVENMRPDAKHRLGVDYDAVRAVNPRIVYGSISGFGQDGPGASYGGVDQIAQGMGGLMSVTGTPDGEPTRAGYAVTDLAAGLHCAIGILVALHERERTGEGRWVQASLLEAAIGLLDFQAVRYTVDGEVPPRTGNHHPTFAPMGCYRTADGHVNVAGWGGRVWERFLVAIGAPELADDPRFATPAERTRHRDELNAAIEERLRARATADWIAAFQEAGVPAGPVNAVDEVFADAQVRHLAMIQPVSHPTLGELRLVANAATLSGLPRSIRTPTPELGEHTREILAELGLSGEEIERCEHEGVV
jgi:crotonobetainyl-CoA:carnitine CoA-transferase CaiB-like acyl-CoA transferase